MKPILYGPDGKPITGKPSEAGFMARIDSEKDPKKTNSYEDQWRSHPDKRWENK